MRHPTPWPPLLCLAAALAISSCSGSQKKNNAHRFGTIAQDVADEGDHEATIQAFENRLARLDTTHQDYPSTLERLALAYLEHTDALLVEAADAPNALAEGPILERAERQRLEAISRFETLTQSFPTYDGTPAALLILVYEYDNTGQTEKRNATLTQLTDSHPLSEYALDGLLLMADEAFKVEKNLSKAQDLYQRIVDTAPNTPRASYALYMQAWLAFNLGDKQTAFDNTHLVLTNSATSDDLHEQARRDMVFFYAQLDNGPSTAKETFGLYAKSDEELAQMLAWLAQLYRDTGHDDWADAL